MANHGQSIEKRHFSNKNKRTDIHILTSICYFQIPERFGKEKKALLKHINENVIGINATFDGPFGRRRGISDTISSTLHVIIIVIY